ncbi:MAG TPA: trypsin-like peptidase domain-containing protein, partial [Gemmatimonadaceae bacterium]|nr:trypsin-like peptidase domain-containing protein [Gemmatimonadaceae bacterium]
ELREADGAWTVFDQQSTNGTFVNGERIDAHRRLFSGDSMSLGANGPQLEVRIADAPRATVASSPAGASALPRRATSERIAEAVEVETASLRRMFGLAIGALLVIAVVAGALWQRRGSARERELLALIARSESASVPLKRTVAAMQARDSQFSRLLAERDAIISGEMRVRRRMAGGSSPEVMAALSERVAQETRLRQAITQMDFPRVHDLNDAAVAMIASDLDGTFIAATAFAISADGALMTNRHVVSSPSGRPPRRIRVLFANTTEWRPARLVRVSETDDLALLRMDEGVPFPVVAGVSRAARETRVGSPVATIGYPHAVDTPMEGAGLDVRARTTTTAGTVSKRLADVLQIDSYAGKGSSGSPVFDVHGLVVGVIYGGEAESQGRIVYAVPAERLAAFVASAGLGSILR